LTKLRWYSAAVAKDEVELSRRKALGGVEVSRKIHRKPVAYAKCDSCSLDITAFDYAFIARATFITVTRQLAASACVLNL
jgi:hypothetical protein